MFDLKAFDLKSLADANPFLNVEKVLADAEKFVTADLEALSAANQKVLDGAVKTGELAQAYVKELTESRAAFGQNLFAMTSFQSVVDAGKAQAEAEQKKGTEFVETVAGLAKDLGTDVASDLTPRFEARVEAVKSAFEAPAAEVIAPAPKKAAPAKSAA